MSLWSKLVPSREVLATTFAPTELPLASPWSTGVLTRIAVADLLGVPAGLVSRADAMKIPPVTRGRGLICGTLARIPVTVWQLGADEQRDQVQPTPSWASSTSSKQSPRLRMLWTLDDLIFSGLSLWARDNADDGSLVDAVRVPPEYWTVDPDSMGVLVQGKPVASDEVILFEGPQEGLLSLADDAIVASRAMANAWRQRVVSPVPLVELHSTDPNSELEPDEVDEAISAWEAARQAGGTAFTPSWIEARMHGTSQTDLMVEGRNAERIDWANYFGLPTASLDGSLSEASLTYSTQEGKRGELLASLGYWSLPIEARLSADDVLPPGQFARFDLSSLSAQADPAFSPRAED